MAEGSVAITPLMTPLNWKLNRPMILLEDCFLSWSAWVSFRLLSLQWALISEKVFESSQNRTKSCRGLSEAESNDEISGESPRRRQRRRHYDGHRTEEGRGGGDAEDAADKCSSGEHFTTTGRLRVRETSSSSRVADGGPNRITVGL